MKAGREFSFPAFLLCVFDGFIGPKGLIAAVFLFFRLFFSIFAICVFNKQIAGLNI